MNDKVSSELFSEYNYESKPSVNKGTIVSKFKFNYPPQNPEIDEDGDLIVDRIKIEGIIQIEHKKTTGLDLVGLQIWRGALLLADWLLHNGKSFKEDFCILELGSGVGFSSIVASIFAPVICTDINKGGLLKLIKGNVLRNQPITKYPIKVLELDFTSNSLPIEIINDLSKIPIIVAADVIYDDLITEAFVKTVQNLLIIPPQRSIYVALEKRYVFTIADCDSVAPCYEHFLKCLKSLKNVKLEELPLDFPQYFHYDRVKELVLWKITSVFN